MNQKKYLNFVRDIFYPGSPVISTKADDLTTHEGMDLKKNSLNRRKTSCRRIRLSTLSQYTYFFLQKE